MRFQNLLFHQQTLAAILKIARKRIKVITYKQTQILSKYIETNETSDKLESSPIKLFSPKPQLSVNLQISSVGPPNQQVNPTVKRKWGKK